MGDPRAVGAQVRMRLPRLTPPEAKADVVPCSTAQNNPLPDGNATTGIAQLNLPDALFVAVAQRDRIAADQTQARTMSAVQSKRRT
jgi:DNA-binding MurR/RpiR family transcriptional regulator